MIGKLGSSSDSLEVSDIYSSRVKGILLVDKSWFPSTSSHYDQALEPDHFNTINFQLRITSPAIGRPHMYPLAAVAVAQDTGTQKGWHLF